MPLVALMIMSVLAFVDDVEAGDASTTVGKYIAVLREQANTAPVSAQTDLNLRRWALYNAKTETATRTQAGLITFLRQEQLAGRVSEIRSLWIVNAVSFTGQTRVAEAVASRAEVREVSVDEQITITDPTGGATRPDLWNLAQSKVREAWRHGYSGAGSDRPIVVGQIDTGVQWQHPALESKFRGLTAPGVADPNYHWIDLIEQHYDPWDPNGHGTHVMGTILGGAGGSEPTDIGIAYGAKWIAARAFDKDGKGFTTEALLASQWMQAPTDQHGLNPRPDFAPDIVNNSWGVDGGCRIWWKLVIESWSLSHIVPVFSVGDGGSSDLAKPPHSPGDLSGAAGVAATDVDGSGADIRAPFSARGPSSCVIDPAMKPDVSAPGMSVKSAVPITPGGPSYALKNGTSMSAAHVSGLAALVLDAAGSSYPVTATVKAIKDNAFRAWDPDNTCDQPNNDLGCGRIDAEKTVLAVRRDGSLTGFVRTSAGVPIANARVSVVSTSTPGETARTAITGPDGAYALTHLSGNYEVTVRAWGYQTLSPSTGCTNCAVTVPNDQTITQNYAMTLATTTAVTGFVRQYGSGDGVAGVAVRIEEAPSCAGAAGRPCLDPVVSDATGRFTFSSVPVSGSDRYTLRAEAGRCAQTKSQLISVPQGSYDIVRPLKRDGFGYFCVEEPGPFNGGSQQLGLRGDDLAATVALPFQFPFYGQMRTAAHISTNGFVRFDDRSSEYFNTILPYAAAPNAAVFPLWTDLNMDSVSKILTSSTDDSFTIEWRDMIFFSAIDLRATFSVTIHRNGDIEFDYLSANHDRAQGSEATIGIEQDFGEAGFQYSFREKAVTSGTSILFSAATAPGLLRGIVNGQAGPLDGAKVAAALEDASGAPTSITRSMVTSSSGSYRLWLNLGSYTVEASAFRYATQVASHVGVVQGQATDQSFNLSKLPVFQVSGVVTDGESGVVPFIPVSLDDQRIPGTVAAADGSFTIADIPAGTYVISPGGSGRCRRGAGVTVNINSNLTQNLVASIVRDGFGYSCEDTVPAGSWISGLQPLGVTGDDGSATVNLLFSFPFYGRAVDVVKVTANGTIEGAPGFSGSNSAVPDAGGPNLSLYPFWANLEIDQLAQVLVASTTDSFTVEWRNARVYGRETARITFEATLHSDGRIEFQYKDLSGDDLSKGASATIGIEDAAGAVGFQYSYLEQAVSDGLRIAFSVRQAGLIGTVRNAVTREPIARAKVTVISGSNTLTALTGFDGTYAFDVGPGTYQVRAAAYSYVTSPYATVTVPVGGAASRLITLAPANVRTVEGTVFDLASRTVGNLGIDISHVDSDHFVGTVFTKERTGRYSVVLPEGVYDLRYTGKGLCMADRIRPPAVRLTVDGPETQNFQFDMLRDAFGYTCRERSTQPARGIVPLGPIPAGTFASVPLPFTFGLYGSDATVLCVAPDGWILVDEGPISGLGGQCLPGAGATTGAKINVFKTPMAMDDQSQLFVGSLPPCTIDCPNNPDDPPPSFVIEWRNVLLQNNERATFSVVLRADGAMEMQYFNGATFISTGRAAQIGLEAPCGQGITYFTPAMDTSVDGLGPIFPGAAIGFLPPSSGPAGC